MLRPDLCDFSDAYIVVKGYSAVTNPENAKRSKSIAFKNNTPCINCISKINGIQIDNAEDLDVVVPMYNLLEYSKNYKKTSGSLWNYYRALLLTLKQMEKKWSKNDCTTKIFE